MVVVHLLLLLEKWYYTLLFLRHTFILLTCEDTVFEIEGEKNGRRCHCFLVNENVVDNTVAMTKSGLL